MMDKKIAKLKSYSIFVIFIFIKIEYYHKNKLLS